MFNTIKKKIKKCYSLNNIQSDETQINKLFIHDDSINNKIQSNKFQFNKLYLDICCQEIYLTWDLILSWTLMQSNQ